MQEIATQISTAPDKDADNHAHPFFDLDVNTLRRLDWRFLLPDPSLQCVVYFGEINTLLYKALHSATHTMIVNPGNRNAELTIQDPCVVVLTKDANVMQALSWVTDSSYLYWEFSPKTNVLDLLGLFFRRYHYRKRMKFLQSNQFDIVTAALHWPNLNECREMIPLDTPLISSKLKKFTRDKKNKWKGWVLGVLNGFGLGHLVLPYSIVARLRPNHGNITL